MGSKLVPLGKKQVLARLHKYGKVVSKKGIKIRFLQNEEKHVRLAYGISKRFVRKAYKRNKIKRWGRHCLRKNLCNESFNLDLLVIITKSWDEYESFEKNMNSLISQIKNQTA